jgi:thioredoxin 2
MAPFYEAAARRLEPTLRFAKLNTEDEPAPAARFGIRSIPTLIVFRAGKEIARQSGSMDAATLTRWLSAIREIIPAPDR